jgi:adenine-specific DNA-methyltransferase
VDKNMNIINFGDVLLDNDHPEKSAIKNEDGSMTIYPIDSDGVERKWRFARHTVDNIKDELRCEEVNGEASIRRYKQKYRWKTVWTDSKYNANIHGTQYLAGIIEEKFPYPKSIFTVEDCIKAIVHDKKDSVILDFFAGSGTTAHAVLRLNKEDGGSRRFILCTNNENKIAENITYPRVKNVIDGYNDVEGIPANLRYYKTEFVDVGSVHSVSDKKKVEITYKAGGMIALREDTLEEIEKNDWWQIFTNKRGKVTAIYFKENKDKLNDLVKQIKRSDDAVLYIFSWGKNEYKNEFTEYKNIRVEDIPEPILEVYKEINKK